MGSLSRHPRYRVLVAVIVFLAFTLTIGIGQYSFGVFLTELEDEFGWTRTEVSAAMSFFAMAGLASLPVGWALDRWGAKPVMAASLAALAISQLLRPGMTELWQFYALNAVQFAAFPGAVMITGARLVGAWFVATRGRVMGLTAMGANFGGFVFSSLTAVLVDGVGWQGAYIVYGLLYASLVPLILLFVREGPEPLEDGVVANDASISSTTSTTSTASRVPATALGVGLREALRARTFYLVVLALLFAQVTYQSVLPQIVPHLENVGITRTTAAASLSVIAVFGMGGKVFFGWFCERYPARFALMFSLLTQIVALVWLLSIGGPAMWLFVPVFGLGFGSLGVIIPLLVQESFGLRAFGTISGMVNFLTLGSALVGPPLVGASFDATGSYQQAFLSICGLFAVAAVAIWFARPLAGARLPAREAATVRGA